MKTVMSDGTVVQVRSLATLRRACHSLFQKTGNRPSGTIEGSNLSFDWRNDVQDYFGRVVFSTGQ